MNNEESLLSNNFSLSLYPFKNQQMKTTYLYCISVPHLELA